ncbi:unnamed protein product [Cylicocyclus nassatus]|uniref:Globin family profile domain-containing protein n=1 Tax=Cylicocyclus nassatus TaxID=53992 RepID=A0AA36DLC7_CYLNA|nr:unnamed protein product [Cylicocyclus nassatus]
MPGAKMMSAARSAGFRYKKQNPSGQKKKKNRSGSISTSSPDRSTPTETPTSTDSPSTFLTVPNAMMRKRSGSVPAFKVVTLKDPSVRNIFYNAAFVETMHERCERRRSNCSIATLRDHTHFFVSLVSQVIQNLDSDPESILNHIDSIGRSHAYLKQYGFRSVLWEKVGEYFVDVVVIQDCVRGFPEACRAWTIMVAALVDRLRAAPRRGSIAVSPAASQTSLNGSTSNLIGSSTSICTIRRGSTISRCIDIEKSAKEAKDLAAINNETIPRRKSGYQGSLADVGCVSMASIDAALPTIRASNPAIA